MMEYYSVFSSFLLELFLLRYSLFIIFCQFQVNITVLKNLYSFFVAVVQLLSCIWLFVTPQTLACQAPLSMVFLRQQCLSGLPFPSPGDLPNPGIKSATPSLAGGFFTAESRGKHFYSLYSIKSYYQMMAMISRAMQFPCSLIGKLFLNASEKSRQNTLKK